MSVKTQTNHSLILVALLFMFSCATDSQENLDTNLAPDNVSKVFENYVIESSITIDNLQVFLIKGKSELEHKKYIALGDALKDKKLIVTETGEVNNLQISNLSKEYVFIHSGDIVKGGKQDRTIANDIIVPPMTKNIDVSSFCVESGRWQQRAAEDVSSFNGNDKIVSSRKIKLAAKYDKNQSKVWSNVATEQAELTDNVSKMNGYSVDVKSVTSASSLQLTLENEELKKASEEMLVKLNSVLDSSFVGYAYAINGKIYGIDIYNNNKLFQDLWTKLSGSIVTEAISDKSEEAFKQIISSDVATFMNGINEAKNTVKLETLNTITDLETTEAENGSIVFSTIDKAEKMWLHKNFVLIDSTDIEYPTNQMRFNDLNLDNILNEFEQIDD